MPFLQVAGVTLVVLVATWVFLPILVRNIIRNYFQEKRTHLKAMIASGERNFNSDK